MPSGPGEQYDFFLSRRGSGAAIAREVTDVLTEKGYKVRVRQLSQCGVEYGVDRSVPPNGTCRIFAIHEVDFPVHGHEVEARSSPATNPGASTLKGAMVVALASR